MDATATNPIEPTGEPANQPTGEMSPEQLAEAKRYSSASLKCHLVDMAVDIGFLTFMAIVGAAWIDQQLAGVSWLAGERSLVRLPVLVAVITAIHACVSLPISWMNGYVIEHKFGMSNQSLGGWFADWLKKMALALVFGAVLFTALYAIVWSTGSYWWLPAAGAFFLFSIVMGQLAPVLLMPLFYKIEPLEDPALNDRMKALADGTGLTIDGVYRLGMSSETKKANAMLAGLGNTRRVLMGDTLLKDFTPEELDVVFAHEIGHHVCGHIRKLIVFGGIAALVGFGATHWCIASVTGIADAAQWPTASVAMMMLALTLIGILMGPLQNWMSRHFEREADSYALERTKNPASFRSAFNKLAQQNKADPSPPWLEVVLLHSHPPIAERLATAEE